MGDELPPHMLKVLGGSENMFTAILYSPDEVADPKGITGKSPISRRAQKDAEKKDGGDAAKVTLDLAASPRGGGGGGASPRGSSAGGASKGGKMTLATQFKTQLQNLMDLLSSTEPYFVRCVKSNPQKKPGVFDEKLIYDQLLYAGMLETIRIRRMGYPIRWTHEDFFKRFRVISPQVGQSKDWRESSRALAETLDLNMPKGAQIGLTKVFLKQEIANELEDRRNHSLTHIIKLMQQWWRMIAARGHFVDAVTNAGILQQWQRMSVPRRRFVAQRKSSYLIQQWWKMQLGRKKLAELKEIKRKEEEERRRKEEEERLARIKKVGEEQVRKEEELKAKLAAEQDDAEREKIRALLAGEGEEKNEEAEDKPKKKEEEEERCAPHPNGIHYYGPKRSLGGTHQCGRQD